MTLQEFIEGIKPLLNENLSKDMLNRQIEFVCDDTTTFSYFGADWDSEKEGNIVFYLLKNNDTTTSINE
jgi:hypothetical protein